MRRKTSSLLVAAVILLVLMPASNLHAELPAGRYLRPSRAAGASHLASLAGTTEIYLDPDAASIPNDNYATQSYTVRISDAVDLYGYQFVVTFDPANVEATAAAFDDTFLSNPLASPSSWSATIDNVTGKVYFARTRQHPDAGVTGSGPLATLTLRGKSGASPGAYQIGYEQLKLSDIDGTSLPVTSQPGWLTLDGATELYLDPEEATIPNDNSTTQTYTARISSAVDLYGYQFVLTFDPANIEATAAAFDDTFLTNPLGSPAGWDATIDNVNGKVRYARTRQHPDLGLTGSGPLATVTLRAKSGAFPGRYPIAFERVKLSDLDGNELPVASQPGWLTLGGPTEVYLDPEDACIPNDNTTTHTFTARILNAANLYGYQFIVTFDPANLKATSAAFDDSFLTNPLGSPAGWDATIDNLSGEVRYARTRQHPDTGINGSGPLATVTFRAASGASAGTYPIGFERLKLSDIDGYELPATSRPGSLLLPAAGDLDGSVDLQGRLDESGGVVTILNAYCGYSNSKTITDPGGIWSFTGIPGGSYQVNIEMVRYLDAQKGSGGSGVTVPEGGSATLNQVKLLGGDANDTTDGTTPNPGPGTADIIDVADAAIIGGEYSYAPPLDVRADINDDGAVDILDVALMGGNYMKTSPVPWP